MRENIEKYIELIIGSILLSLGIYLFVTPNGINFGGAIGIAQIIEYFIVKMIPSLGHMNLVGIINFMINIPLFVMGFKIMNKEFCIKTVISLVVQTITLSILPKQSFVIMPDMLSNCIFGALMCGIGVGLALQSVDVAVVWILPVYVYLRQNQAFQSVSFQLLSTQFYLQFVPLFLICRHHFTPLSLWQFFTLLVIASIIRIST